MAAVRSKDTEPELLVRRLVHGMGYRYRLHRPDLPGKPDLVLPGRRKIIFVHGCFWHQHTGCARSALPKSHANYWKDKLVKNVQRDAEAIRMLRDRGWKVLVIWECQLLGRRTVERSVSRFLSR